MMVGKMVAIIKQHYRKFLKKPDQGTNNQKSDLNDCSNRSESKLSWAHPQSSDKDIRSEGGEGSEFDSEERDKMPFPSSQKFHSEYNSQLSRSENGSKKSQGYKPRQGSQAALIIKFMKILNASTKSVSKKDLDRYALENNYDKIKQWKNVK